MKLKKCFVRIEPGSFECESWCLVFEAKFLTTRYQNKNQGSILSKNIFFIMYFIIFI